MGRVKKMLVCDEAETDVDFKSDSTNKLRVYVQIS